MSNCLQFGTEFLDVLVGNLTVFLCSTGIPINRTCPQVPSIFLVKIKTKCKLVYKIYLYLVALIHRILYSFVGY